MAKLDIIYECEYCGATTNTLSGASAHRKLDHPRHLVNAIRIYCPLCKTTFRDEDIFIIHLIERHESDPEVQQMYGDYSKVQ